MFIARALRSMLAPFGGAEINWTCTRLVTFRSSERRRRGCFFWSYKHLISNGVKPFSQEAHLQRSKPLAELWLLD